MKNWTGKFEKGFISLFTLVTDALFLPTKSRLLRWQRCLQWGWILALLLGGLTVWIFFLNGGQIQFMIHDWPKEWGYYSILKQAVTDGIIPLHSTSVTNTPDRFMTNPETVLSPQIILLRFLEPGPFVLINTLILFTIGFIGCIKIKQRYNLSPFIFGVLILLLGFNGHILTHMSVGHSMWLGFYFLPFFFLQLLHLFENNYGKSWAIWTGLILFGVIIQGSVHIFVWCIIFLAILLVISKPHRQPILKSLILTILLTAFRLLPAVLQYATIKQRFFPGYLSLTEIFAGMIADYSPYEAIRGRPMGWWEQDMYIGLVGLVFILFFGLYPFLRRNRNENMLFKYLPLYIPGGFLAIFSLGYIYLPIQSLPIPFVSLERVPSRFLIMPITMLIILASIYAQGWMAERLPRLKERVIYLCLFLIFGQDLLQHARMWRIENLARALPIPERILQLDIQIISLPDPTYTSILWISAVITMVAIAYSAIQLIRYRKS